MSRSPAEQRIRDAQRQVYADMGVHLPEPMMDAGPVVVNRKPRARGRTTRHVPGTMNKTEQAYADHLRLRVLAGEVAWYAFEALKLKLADRCWYHVDYAVLMSDGVLELHEVKGFMEDDAAVKLRMVRELYWMFPLKLARRRNGQWIVENR